MRLSQNSLFLLLATGTVQALSLNEVTSNVKRGTDAAVSNVKEAVHKLFARQASAKENTCPKIWSQVASDLRDAFVSGGQCNDDARAAIRLVFHDCISGAGCDGSIILAGEYQRLENSGLEDIAVKVGNWAKQYNVGTADMIAFAAASGISACPGGPEINALVGRKDSYTAAPEGEIPSPKSSVTELLSQFAAKGFSATDMTALVGAHTAAKQRFVEPQKAGSPLDSTPGSWDTKFYSQTLDGSAPVSLDSDVNISRDDRTSGAFQRFQSVATWSAAFVPAAVDQDTDWFYCSMNRMTTIGNGGQSLVDCSSIIKSATRGVNIKAAPLADRVRNSVRE
ncbi:heme peroxidase [Phyllosticta citriasiana]|uniref:heme peroxidase n=1 Tax=Phyllosticta citriasiana TaxID=595635 RepID=UPI0030FD5877